MSKACPRRRYRGSDLAVTAGELNAGAGVGRQCLSGLTPLSHDTHSGNQ